MWTKRGKRVKKCQNNVDVIYGSPLIKYEQWLTIECVTHPIGTTPEPWTPSTTGSSSEEGCSASSSGSISPIAAKQQTAAMAAAHARLAAVAVATNLPEFGKGGKFKSHGATAVAAVKDSRAHSAPAVQHRKPMSAEDETWLHVMPRQRVRPRECDEVPAEFRRAGIGLCFEGKTRVK